MLNIHKDYSLLGHNTFGIDARTAAFVEYSSEAELLEAARMLREGALPSPWLHIGGGSNLLLTRDWPGTVLHSRITGCETVSENEDAVEVRVGSGVVWDDFVEMCVERGWYGAENLSAIPGETGAAAVQNIGAYGVEVKDLILEVETLDMASGQKKVFPAADCGYGYRRSIFKQQDNKRFVVLSVLFRLGLRPQLNLGYKALSEALSGRDNITLRDVRETVRAVRSSKLPDPSETGSAGSFFTNPVVSRSKFIPLPGTASSSPPAGSSSSADGRAAPSEGPGSIPSRPWCWSISAGPLAPRSRPSPRLYGTPSANVSGWSSVLRSISCSGGAEFA